MFIAALPTRAVLSCTSNGEISSSEIIFYCDPIDESGLLEIGEKHAFASKTSTGFRSKRRSCELRLYMRRRSALSPERVEKIGLSGEKIGVLSFYPDFKPKDFVPGRSATLEAFVFVSEEIFETVSKALQSGRKTEAIHLEIEKKGRLNTGGSQTDLG